MKRSQCSFCYVAIGKYHIENSYFETLSYVLLCYYNGCGITLLSHQRCFMSPDRCVVCLVYYGLSLSSATLAGNLYVNFALSGAIELPSNIVCAILLKRYVCVT